MATVLAQRYSGRSDEFRVNYAFDPASIRTISAADVIAGRYRDELKDKTVVVGLAAERLGDQFMLPGWGKMSGVYIHIIGAETLKAGKPIDLGWIPAFLIAAALVVLTIKRTGRQQILALGSGLVGLLLVPVLLERAQIFADITPGLFVISWVGIGLLLRNAKRRGLTNAISGLPNLNALRRANMERDRPLIVARVVNDRLRY